VATDETTPRRGHHYTTLLVDIDQARVVFASEGEVSMTVNYTIDQARLADRKDRQLLAGARHL
jgi:hypothetical protein